MSFAKPGVYYPKHLIDKIPEKYRRFIAFKNPNEKMSNILYDIESIDFCKNPYRIFPYIEEFLASLSPKNNIINSNIPKSLHIYGIPYYSVLSKDKLELFTNCSITKLNHKDNSLDSIIIINSLQYEDPIVYRIIFNEIKRVLVYGGKCLISNWAVEESLNIKNPLKKGFNVLQYKNWHVYCHILDKELAEEVINELPNGLKLIKLEWNSGNWNFILQKN